jgi:hypothetical protein
MRTAPGHMMPGSQSRRSLAMIEKRMSDRQSGSACRHRMMLTQHHWRMVPAFAHNAATCSKIAKVSDFGGTIQTGPSCLGWRGVLCVLGVQAMNRPLPLILALGVLGGSTASAMPVAPLASTQPSLTIQSGSGCGLGVRRGTFYDCPPYRAYRGYDYDPYDRGYARGYRRGFYRG